MRVHLSWRLVGLAAAAVLPSLAVPLSATSTSTAPAPRPLSIDRPLDAQDTRPRSEISLAVHPSDPRRVAVAAIQFGRSYRDAFLEGPFISFNRSWVSGDGGRTFTVGSDLPSVRPQTPGGNDPTLAWGPGDVLYSSYTSFSGVDARSSDEGLYVARSVDGGRSWRRGAHLEGFDCGGPDRSTVAVDPRRGHVFVTWVHYVEGEGCDGAPDQSRTVLRWARSTDGGQTFSSPVEVAPPGTSSQAAPAVLPDGTLVVTHVESGGLQPEQTTCQFPSTVFASRFSPEGRLIGRTSALSTCNTAAGLSPNGATYVPLSSPVISADARTGRLLVAMPTVAAGATGVAVAGSSDGGRSWSATLVEGLPGSTASMVALASGPRDRAALAFLEIDAGGFYRPVLSATIDGGRTWSQPVSLATVPSVGNVRPESPFDGYGIGHYLGVGVGRDGIAHVAWPDLRPDGMQSQDVDIWVRSVQLP